MHCGEPSMVTLLQAATVCWQTAPADLSQLQGFDRSSSTQHFIWCRLDPSLAPNWVAVAVLSADPSDALTAQTTTATPWLEALGRAIHWHESWRIERELHRQALARMDWIEQALCFAREVVWELDCNTMRIRYSRYIATLDRPAAHALPLSLDDFLHSVHHEDRPTVSQRDSRGTGVLSGLPSLGLSQVIDTKIKTQGSRRTMSTSADAVE